MRLLRVLILFHGILLSWSSGWAAIHREVNLLLDLNSRGSSQNVRETRFDSLARKVGREFPKRHTVVLKIEAGYRNIGSQLKGVLAPGDVISFFYLDTDTSPWVSDHRGRPELDWVLNGTVMYHPFDPEIVDEAAFFQANRILDNPFEEIRGRFSRDAQVLVNLTDDRRNGKWEVTQRADLVRHLLGVKSGTIFVSREWVPLWRRVAILVPSAIAFYASAILGGLAYRHGNSKGAGVAACVAAIAYGANQAPDYLPRPGFSFEISEGAMRPGERRFQHSYLRRLWRQARERSAKPLSNES